MEVLSSSCAAQMQTSTVKALVIQYATVIMTDGDFLNDFLADIPPCAQPLIEIVGRTLALAFGFAA
jgi:hypothetical protein